jgi:acetyl esterase/lipase
MSRWICFALVFFATLPALAEGPPEKVDFTRDVVYGKGGDEDLKLNISRPKGDAKNLPCLIFIHGGGWAMGDRSAHDNATWHMAQIGYVSATIGYRLAPKHQFPAQVEDVKCAVRYLRAHADKHGLDPKRIGVCGFSAGAHLAMLLGTMDKTDGLEGTGGWAEQSSKAQVVVSYFGPTDLAADNLPQATKPITQQFFGGTVEQKRDEYVKASPVTYVNAGDAPLLLIQGTKDPLVPYTQVYRMLDAMTEAGVEGRADIIVGAGHGWGGAEFARTATESLVFVDQYLKKPTTQPAKPSR